MHREDVFKFGKNFPKLFIMTFQSASAGCLGIIYVANVSMLTRSTKTGNIVSIITAKNQHVNRENVSMLMLAFSFTTASSGS